MVSQSVALLGEVIRDRCGKSEFDRIEKIRLLMTSFRDESLEYREAALTRLFKELKKLPAAPRARIVHSYTLMLELMNAAENAYRSYRLRQSPEDKTPTIHPGQTLIFVLTAHPTESRSPKNIEIFSEIQRVIQSMYSESFEHHAEALRHLLEMAWRIAVARSRKPTVMDEAEHIYSIILREEILVTLLDFSERGLPIFLRSWVGGDKDGHPGVDEQKLHRSLEISRGLLLKFVMGELRKVEESLKLVGEEGLRRKIRKILGEVGGLKRIRSGDGGKVKKIRADISAVSTLYKTEMGALHPSLERLRSLVRIFPAWVVPLELREASDRIELAVKDQGEAIVRMLLKVRDISKGGDAIWYARGLIISMTRDLTDVKNAAGLVERVFGEIRLPVIPLFEQAKALGDAKVIGLGMLRDKKIRHAIDHHWDGLIEFMLGYSDSSKEMGVFPSRLKVSETLNELDQLCRSHKVTPVFFHGSGGSVDRGGGSLSEQISWWPVSALRFYKTTIQGEMIERSFSSPEILRGQIHRMSKSWIERSKRGHSVSKLVSRGDLDHFAARVSECYRSQLRSPTFNDVVHWATAYRYLRDLRLGSRPSKRTRGFSFQSLRAIPWVMCWTQTRILFPTWWGTGTAWENSSTAERLSLRKAFQADPLFRSYMKVLGFTLAKVELPIWKTYLDQSGLSLALATSTFDAFQDEFNLACRFVRELTGERELVWFRPWLLASIRLRAPMIHPLNLIQILSLDKRSPELVRETVTGIASGMMTTG